MKKVFLNGLMLDYSNTLSNKEKKMVRGGMREINDGVPCNGNCDHDQYVCLCGVCVDKNMDTDCWCC